MADIKSIEDIDWTLQHLNGLINKIEREWAVGGKDVLFTTSAFVERGEYAGLVAQRDFYNMMRRRILDTRKI